MMIGYARVSKFERSRVIDLQRDAFTGAGVDLERIYEDRLSGSRDDRLGLAAYRKALRSGDTLVDWKLDRLGRTVNQLIMLIEDLRASEIGFRSLTEEIDTSRQAGSMFFDIFAALSQFERDRLRERARDGIEAARWRACSQLLVFQIGGMAAGVTDVRSK